MNGRLEEIKIFEAMKETILKKEPDEDKQWLINRVQELEEENQRYKAALAKIAFDEKSQFFEMSPKIAEEALKGESE